MRRLQAQASVNDRRRTQKSPRSSFPETGAFVCCPGPVARSRYTPGRRVQFFSYSSMTFLVYQVFGSLLRCMFCLARVKPTL